MATITEYISPQIVANLGRELLSIVGENVKTADTSLYERKTLNFRDIVDNNFPTMLIADYTSIRSELSQYRNIDETIKASIGAEYTATDKDLSRSKLTDKEIDLLLAAIKRGISLVPSEPIQYSILKTKLDIILANAETNTLSGRVVQEIKQLFSKTYRLLGVPGSQDILLFPNFANTGTVLRGYLDKALTAEEISRDIYSIDLVGSMLDYGHTAVGYVDSTTGNTNLKFNSPKALAIMFDVLESSSSSSKLEAIQKLLTAVSLFVEETRQAEVFINIDKEFSDGFAKVFIEVGGNVVRFENKVINSRRGSVLEKKTKLGINAAVLKRLATAFTQTSTTVGSRLSRYIINKKNLPSLLDYIIHSTLSTIKGEKVGKYVGGGKEEYTAPKYKIKSKTISGISKSKATIPKLLKIKKSVIKPTLNLTNLQNLLNQRLHDQIKLNMGTGQSRSTLNYRSGRLAQSAQVERMSESRAGMITAFYLYMKYPYATFSDGGAQQSPKSRDPKLLIAKSIREIAGTTVANRMRAVNI